MVGVCLARLEAAHLAQAIVRCVEDNAAFRSNAAVLARRLRWETEADGLNRLVANLLAQDMRRVGRHGS